MIRDRYTSEQIDFLTRHIKGTSFKELTEIFNREFGTERTVNKIRATCTNHSLRNGRDTHFLKGQRAYINPDPKANSGSFKKGNIPSSAVSVGSEVIDKDGYIRVKIAEPKQWKYKHRLVWESINGEVPKGSVVIFLNNDRADCRIENLRLIKRCELQRLNKKYSKLNNELKETALNLVKLECDITQKLRKNKNNRERCGDGR